MVVMILCLLSPKFLLGKAFLVLSRRSEHSVEKTGFHKKCAMLTSEARIEPLYTCLAGQVAGKTILRENQVAL
jgi:hypothetical protein